MSGSSCGPDGSADRPTAVLVTASARETGRHGRAPNAGRSSRRQRNMMSSPAISPMKLSRTAVSRYVSGLSAAASLLVGQADRGSCSPFPIYLDRWVDHARQIDPCQEPRSWGPTHVGALRACLRGAARHHRLFEINSLRDEFSSGVVRLVRISVRTIRTRAGGRLLHAGASSGCSSRSRPSRDGFTGRGG